MQLVIVWIIGMTNVLCIANKETVCYSTYPEKVNSIQLSSGPGNTIFELLCSYVKLCTFQTTRSFLWGKLTGFKTSVRHAVIPTLFLPEPWTRLPVTMSNWHECTWRKKSSWGNQVSLITFFDYEKPGFFFTWHVRNQNVKITKRKPTVAWLL